MPQWPQWPNPLQSPFGPASEADSRTVSSASSRISSVIIRLGVCATAHRAREGVGKGSGADLRGSAAPTTSDTTLSGPGPAEGTAVHAGQHGWFSCLVPARAVALPGACVASPGGALRHRAARGEAAAGHRPAGGPPPCAASVPRLRLTAWLTLVCKNHSDAEIKKIYI